MVTDIDLTGVWKPFCSAILANSKRLLLGSSGSIFLQTYSTSVSGDKPKEEKMHLIENVHRSGRTRQSSWYSNLQYSREHQWLVTPSRITRITPPLVITSVGYLRVRQETVRRRKSPGISKHFVFNYIMSEFRAKNQPKNLSTLFLSLYLLKIYNLIVILIAFFYWFYYNFSVYSTCW